MNDLSPPYTAIVADPPWPQETRFNQSLTRVGRVPKMRDQDQHYDLMTRQEIFDLDVNGLAAENAHCYLWATNTHLEFAFEVLRTWGFTYKSMLTWCKTGHLGLGRYFRSQTEHVLFGVKGRLHTLSRTQKTYFEAPKRGHSVKPDEFYDLVEHCSPGPYVDLFARKRRVGWDSWGKELG